MNYNKTKQLIIVCLLGIGLSSCDPEWALFGPVQTMEVFNELSDEIDLICEEYKEGKNINRIDGGAYYPLSSSYSEQDSIPHLNFEEWFPKVMTKVDSIVVRTKDNSVRRVWRKTDVFEENEHHVYNINCWEFNDHHSVWRYNINWEDLE